MARHLPTFNKVTLPLIFFGSLFLLASALKAGQGFRNRERLTALTGLLGLLYVGSELYWYFYVSLLQPRGIATAYYFARHLLGGISVGMLLYIVSPKSEKVVLVISALSLVAFDLLVVALYGPRHLASAIRVCSLGNGLFIGMSIPTAILLWLRLDHGKGSSQNGNGDAGKKEGTIN
jgi:peptidoglycan/LPS O-acetylase OafA/YrhL